MHSVARCRASAASDSPSRHRRLALGAGQDDGLHHLGQRQFGLQRRRGRLEGTDAGDDLVGDAGLVQQRHLLLNGAVKAGVAGVQPHHALAGAGRGDERSPSPLPESGGRNCAGPPWPGRGAGSLPGPASRRRPRRRPGRGHAAPFSVSRSGSPGPAPTNTTLCPGLRPAPRKRPTGPGRRSSAAGRGARSRPASRRAVAAAPDASSAAGSATPGVPTQRATTSDGFGISATLASSSAG